MKAFVYRTTKSPVPGWQSVHEKQPRGVAYETDQHFVHIYGAADQLWTISNGLTVTDKKDGTLADWIIGQFGGENIEQSNLDVGSTIEGVWRPGLFYDVEMLQGLAETNVNLRLAEQALLLLIQRLDELLLFVEPTTQSLAAHSHKARELLILACTGVEAQWKHHALRGGLQPKNQGFKTNDYVLLSGPLNLGESRVSNQPSYASLFISVAGYSWFPNLNYGVKAFQDSRATRWRVSLDDANGSLRFKSDTGVAPARQQTHRARCHVLADRLLRIPTS